ncbi:MAG: T9SS type A sorting domain-containing protein [Bacteroidales bacterium]|nr:T9SS type A sorting domain-containing protein [Candidatus Latescibacterota bacterium]
MTHGPADVISIVSGEAQTAVVNNPVLLPLTIRVIDAWGNEVNSETVSFAVITGGGQVDTDTGTGGIQTTSVTDIDGIAVCDEWILGTVSGNDSDGARASISSGSITSVDFSATSDHDVAASIVLSPLSGVVTVNSQTIITATLEDQYSNLVTDEDLTIFIKDDDDGGLSEDLSNPNSTDALGPSMRSGTTDGTGTISVVYDAPGGAGLSDVIDADNSTIAANSVDDVTYTTVASGATKLIVTDITNQPSQAGESYSFVVKAVDSNDNLDPSNSSHIVLSPETGGGLLFSLSDFGATVTEADLVNGSVTLYGMATTVGVWQTDITASFPVLTATAFDIETVANENVHHYVFNSPASAVAGDDFSIQLQAKDIYGNLVTTASYDIDLRAVQAADTTADASSSLSITTGAVSAGIYQEANLQYNIAENIRIEVSDIVSSVIGVTDVIDIQNAAAYQIVETGGDSTGVAAGDSILLRAEVFDRFGNNVSGERVSFSILEGGGGLVSSQRFSRIDGTTSVTCRTGTSAGLNRIRAAILDGNPEGLETRVYEISTIPSTAISYVTLAIEGTTFEAGEEFNCDVQAFDAFDNLITTDNTSILIPFSESASMVFDPDTITLSAGIASFTAFDTVMGDNRIAIESIVGLQLSAFSPYIEINAGPAYRITEISGDTTGVISGDTTLVSVRVRDEYGNPVEGEVVRFSVTSDLGGVTGLIDDTGVSGDGLAASDVSGMATCSLITDSNAGTNILEAVILDAEPPSREKVEFTILTTAGTISRYVITTSDYTRTAGDHVDVTIVAYDLNNNISYGDFTTVVDLGSNQTAVWDTNPVTLSDGSVSTGFTETLAGPLVLSAETSGGGALSHSDTVFVGPDLPSGAIPISSVIPDTITASGKSLSSITTGQVLDAYGNIVDERTLITVSVPSGTIDSDDMDNTIPGVQRETSINGVTSVFIESSLTSGEVIVDFESVSGSAAGAASIFFAEPPGVEYAGYISPIFIVPGSGIEFKCLVTNSSPTGSYLDVSSNISFNDGTGNIFNAVLASPVFLHGGSTDTLYFAETTLPAGFIGGTYTPEVNLSGTDIYDSDYSADFNAGSNSISVSNIEITGITAFRTVLSRGDTTRVDVTLVNNGGSLAIIRDIVIDFAVGNYSLTGDVVPSLPDTIYTGLETTYSMFVYVLPNCPLGIDTIDASVHATVGGINVYDYSADEYCETWLIQSASLISYEPGSFDPTSVSTGQDHSFSVIMNNLGQAPVILEETSTRISFDDGVTIYSALLEDESAIPGEGSARLSFLQDNISSSFIPGKYPVLVELSGFENGGLFDTSIVLADSIDIETPASLSYISSTLSPMTVSKNSSVTFQLDVTNTGGADVYVDEAASYLTFNDGTTIYTANVDADRTGLILPGENTFYFDPVVIAPGFVTGIYTPLLHIEGLENGLDISVDPIVADDVSVEDPSRLAINSIDILPTDRMTADQTTGRAALIRIENNGEASVRLDSLDVRLFIGNLPVTGQYQINPVDFVEGVEILAGGQLDSFHVSISDELSNSMNTGTVTVESTVWGTDLNSSDELIATTEYGGKGSFAVETEADPVITGIISSITSATVSQTRDWKVDVIIENHGESDLDVDLDPLITYLVFSTSNDFDVISPVELAGGGMVLEGGSTDTLKYIIDLTGSIPGICEINAEVSSMEINSGRNIGPVSMVAGSGPEVEIQTTGVLSILGITGFQDPVTIGQVAEWEIEMSVLNSGGSALTIDTSDLDSTRVLIPGSSGFVIDHPAELEEGGNTLTSGESGTLRFTVSTTGVVPPGRRVISGRVLGVEDNSENTIFAELDETASTDSVEFDLRADPQYSVSSLSPLSVSSGTDISIELEIFSSDLDQSTLILDRNLTTVWFGDTDGDTLRASLSAVSPDRIDGGSASRLIFNSTEVFDALDRQAYTAGIHLEGSENGNPFIVDLTSTPDQLIVEEAPQLSITSIETPSSVTSGLQPTWQAWMVLHNTGEASVLVSTDPDSTDISISIAGLGDVTSEYTITPPDHLQESGTLVLAGGQIDTLVFTVEVTGITSGTALVNGVVSARDINSGDLIDDDTFTGGGSFMAVQEPAVPVIISSISSVDTLTSGQNTPWTVMLEIENQGGASLTLAPDSTFIYGDYALSIPVSPATFLEGGISLAGGETKHMIFEITPTPDIPGGYDLGIDAKAGFFEDNRQTYLYSSTEEMGIGGTAVRVQIPGQIEILALESLAPNTPRVNRDQDVSIVVDIRNIGEACLGQVNLTLAGDGSSSVLDSPLVLNRLCGGETLRDTFHVRTADMTGIESFVTSVQSAVDLNSGETGLFNSATPIDDTELLDIEDQGALLVTSLLPSQAEVNAGQTTDWVVRVDLINSGDAPISVEDPASTDLIFSIDGNPLSDYLVIPPEEFASGSADMVLESGEVDSFVFVVSSTGIDTGQVRIDGSIRWSDENEPARGILVSTGDSGVRVREPSGLRIISVTSDAPNSSMFPNTSIVNTGQEFRLTVTVENTGGDDLEQVAVDLLTNGDAMITPDSATPDLASGAEGDFIFLIQSGGAGVEILSAGITTAISVNTGEEVPPIQALESIENLQVQVSAVLVCEVDITAPLGAVDDTVSTLQEFILTAAVRNMGEAGDDGTGQVTLELPPGFSRLYPDADSIVRSFSVDEEIAWTLRATDVSAPVPSPVTVFVSRPPRDVNMMEEAFVLQAADTEKVYTEDAASIDQCEITITAPSGAEDGVLSTGQTFTVRSEFMPSMNSGSTWVELALPFGFSITGNAVVLTGDGTGELKQVIWTVETGSGALSEVSLNISTGGIDMNSSIEYSGCSGLLDVTVVQNARLDLNAIIAGPPQAVEGKLSVDLPFTVEAMVTNTGTAGIDTTGARLEIELPDNADYSIAPGETFRKPFEPGQSVTWDLIAPGTAAPPGIIAVRIAAPYPVDENSREAVDTGIDEIPISVTTEEGAISMLNISSEDTIPPYVVPQGAEGVPVLKFIVANRSAYTAGLDTAFVSVTDGRGNLHSDPSRYVSALYIDAEGIQYAAVAGENNPVPLLPVSEKYTVDPSADGIMSWDTMIVSIDIADGAPSGSLGLELSTSSDVVFSRSADQGAIAVVWGAENDDIAGHFETGPLTVMAADFEEYVHNYPNPFKAGSETTKITYFLTSDSSVSVMIYDLLGSLVWKKDIPAGEQGATGETGGTLWEMEWDGRNGRGEIVRNGVYICKVQAGGKSALFKIAVAK